MKPAREVGGVPARAWGAGVVKPVHGVMSQCPPVAWGLVRGWRHATWCALVPASCVGAGLSPAGLDAATRGCLRWWRGAGRGRQPAFQGHGGACWLRASRPGVAAAGQEVVVASGGVLVGGLGGGVAHSSWAPAGPLASFQRFPAPGGVRGQDECATRAPLHIHPGSQAQAGRWIRVISPFIDRRL